MKTFLHVGCGGRHQNDTTPRFSGPDWRELRLDINRAVEPDIVGSMTDMKGVADQSVDAIFSSHNIEHLYAHEVPIALSEFLRVLKPDGFVVITCPDLQSVAALVADDKLTDVAYVAPSGPIAPLDMLYGYRPDLAKGDVFMAHRCGFTERILRGSLLGYGFKMVATRRRAEAFDLWALACKRLIPETELRALAAEHFPD